MPNSVIADLLVVLHAAFILWVACGAFAVLRWPPLAWLHVPAVSWGVYIAWSGGICPLTPLEVRLREAAGEAGYSGSFIDHYLMPWIYPQGLTRQLQLALGGFVLLLNLVLYVHLVRRARQRHHARS